MDTDEDRGGEAGDSDTERVPLAEFERVVAALERFAGADSVTVDGDCARAQMGSAGLALCRDGRVTGAMPLHEFDGEGAVAVFDYAAGELRVQGEDLEYTFRRP
jgi:hypothetical protein